MISPRFLLRSWALVTIAAMLVPSTGRAATATRSRASAPAYDVRITPTTQPEGSTSIDIGSDLWSVQGFDLRGVLAQLYTLNPSRIDLPPAVLAVSSDASAPRFDVTVALHGDESEEAVQRIVTSALERRFHLVAAYESRTVPALVLTAPNGAGAGLQPAAASRHDVMQRANLDEAAPESITVTGRFCPGLTTARIIAHGATVASLARALEEQLGRVILDETRLNTPYNFEVPEFRTQEQLAGLLHDRLGLELHEGRREVRILAIHTTAETSAPQTTQALLRTVAF